MFNVKNAARSKKTTRRGATPAFWSIFAELDKPKRTLSKMNLLNIDAGKHANFSYVFKLGIILNE